MPKLQAELKQVVNNRLAAVPPAQIRAFDEEISAIPGLVKLTLGEPDFAVPDHVKKAAIQSIENNDSHYSASKGKIELRQAISNYLKQTRHVDYDPETEIVVTVGATEAVTATTFAMLNPGDKVIIPTPAFSLYFPSVSLTGAEPIKVDTSADGFLLSAKRLKEVLDQEGPAVKAVLLNYPNNPTGRSYSESELQELAKVIQEHHIYAIVDEIYSSLMYDQPFHSLATILPEQTVLISGLSKSHAMTGYRLGYVAGPADFISTMSKMHSFMVTAPNDTAQVAAIEALTNGDNDPQTFKQIYRKRRDRLATAMQKMGFEIALPDGAFYIFAKIPAQFGNDDLTFARKVAHEARVGVIPGNAFGPGGEGYIRLSYAAADSVIDTAIERLQTFMNDLTQVERRN
ncbi:aminotransferase class I/II-fold pyridoxal phosphate-dependent enzyme [Limosilactobacillus sp. STM2_1]|uniref:Aminotransferase n=1 Tax=Limosilactobacillus rudii TaxID=2759755 RepID=A0A7W3ULS1_9LACO|nr:aminotransferase class I/II-fold pyridoxal phosphate-dependent enzyme [Limosilactobacillus rudii]MBB1078565.1 aminotransferase class I/II-fold pyridoxal phosphate-dependent enzyme [Limosilactobacillus rudii]MBB1097205.1 aminotransferase class I/II-fold pyridoxal phosphate-dependent enzyme [Limosilactobacillus rudii]MCD7133879.1 aminotransferase class I/II-fold pyridoxal phosphate-dependent enzyme [Limosilactobacillus rudii]